MKRFIPKLVVRRLTHDTLTSVHIRRLRAYAETTAEHELVTECDQAMRPPMDPLIWALDLRRRLAGHYNALFIGGATPLGHWAAHAWRQVALAWGRLYYYPDFPRRSDPYRGSDASEVSDYLVEAQALLRSCGKVNTTWK